MTPEAVRMAQAAAWYVARGWTEEAIRVALVGRYPGVSDAGLSLGLALARDAYRLGQAALRAGPDAPAAGAVPWPSAPGAEVQYRVTVTLVVAGEGVWHRVWDITGRADWRVRDLMDAIAEEVGRWIEEDRGRRGCPTCGRGREVLEWRLADLWVFPIVQ